MKRNKDRRGEKRGKKDIRRNEWKESAGLSNAKHGTVLMSFLVYCCIVDTAIC